MASEAEEPFEYTGDLRMEWHPKRRNVEGGGWRLEWQVEAVGWPAVNSVLNYDRKCAEIVKSKGGGFEPCNP